MSAPSSPWQPSWVDQSQDNLGPTYIAVCTIFFFLATIAFFMRLVAQRIVSHSFYADDYTIIVGWVLTLLNYIVTIICFTHGGGRHIEDIIANDEDPVHTMMVFWEAGYVTINAWVWSSFAIKLSLYFYLYRIFSPSKIARVCLNVTLGFIIASFIYCFFSYIFVCTPIRLFWYQAYTNVGQVSPVTGSCPAYLPRGVAAAGSVILTDLLLLIVPIAGVWNLQMKRHRKFGLVGIFMLGLFAVTISIVRLPYIWTESLDDDPSYINANALLFSILETTVGMICVSLPCMAPLYRKWKGRKEAAYGSYEYRTSHKSSTAVDSRGLRSQKSQTDTEVDLTPEFIQFDNLKPEQQPKQVF